MIKAGDTVKCIKKSPWRIVDGISSDYTSNPSYGEECIVKDVQGVGLLIEGYEMSEDNVVTFYHSKYFVKPSELGVSTEEIEEQVEETEEVLEH